ncbi:DUF4157 domain-containing protein [Streptomyces sp. col6]|nr:DUF4157 domain-containing protein [Streptomyces sp. col6]
MTPSRPSSAISRSTVQRATSTPLRPRARVIRGHHRYRPTRHESLRSSARTPVGRGAIPLPGLLALQGSVGNAAVVQILNRTGYPWAHEEHEHSAGCGHQPAERPVQCSAVPDVLRSPGSPLDDDTRTEMETRLGADLADVRAQTDTTARASAAEVGAHAYTSGNHVVTGDGGADKHTLAHELTHVIQQRKGPVAGTDSGYGLKDSNLSDRFERAAEENAHRVMSGSSPVQREAVDAGRGPSTAGGGAPVQRTFQMTSKTYDAGNAEELTEAIRQGEGRPEALDRGGEEDRRRPGQADGRGRSLLPSLPQLRRTPQQRVAAGQPGHGGGPAHSCARPRADRQPRAGGGGRTGGGDHGPGKDQPARHLPSPSLRREQAEGARRAPGHQEGSLGLHLQPCARQQVHNRPHQQLSARRLGQARLRGTLLIGPDPHRPG